MTQEQKARAYDEAKERMRAFLKEWENCGAYGEAMEKARNVFPELAESEDERIRKWIKKEIEDKYVVEGIVNNKLADEAFGWLEKQKHLYETTKDRFYREGFEEGQLYEKQKEKKPIRDIVSGDAIESCMLRYLQSAANRKDDIEIIEDTKAYKSELISIIEKEQKPIKMEVYEVGKGTTICGQDYKCKKDYKEGNCWYIKDVIYHCGRDGYLNDQNGVSWSCTPEWFNEYIYTNSEWADEEKNYFVSEQFLRCKLSFEEFKEGEHYWLEYVGDDMYVGRSDNILNQKFHITPRQLYTLFSEKLEEVQGPPQEEKQVSLNYEPPFDENPSDKEIIKALIKHLKEQDGFLTAINCVSTKAILSWLKKQKEQKPVDYETELKKCKDNPLYFYDKYVSIKQKPAEWGEEDEHNLNSVINLVHTTTDGAWGSCIGDRIENWLKNLPERFSPQPNPEVEGDNETEIRKAYREGKNAGRKEVFDHPGEYGLEYIDNVFGFKIGDKVRLSDGDGRTHTIKRFVKIEGIHGPDFYRVIFQDNTASPHIIPGDEFPDGYFTCVRKVDEEKPETGKGE